MTIKRRDPEFLHPDTVAYLQGLTDEEAAKHSPIVRERDGVFMQYWRIGRRVRCREVEASGVPASETGALHAAAEAELGRLLPLLTAELLGGGVPDLDAIETTVRDGVLGGGAKYYAALLEAVDARLAGKSPPSCPSCGRRMERRGRVGKTFGTRLGEARVKRRYFYCRKCGVGDYPLDRALRLAGKRVTPGAEAVYADAAGSDSCGEARRKLWNLAGVAVSRATLQRHSVRIGEDPRGEGRHQLHGRRPGSEDRGASEGQGQRGDQRPHRQREGGGRRRLELGVRRPPAAVRAPERLGRGQGIGGAVRRGALDPQQLRGGVSRAGDDLHPRPVPCPPIRGRGCESRSAARERTEGLDEDDQGPVERRAGR